MQWPPDLESKIVGTSLSDDLTRIVTMMRATLQPRRGGATHNSFFCTNESVPTLPISKNREVQVALPSVLMPFYETYEPTTEFSGPRNLIFLSEEHMRSHSVPGSVDMAFKYAGMGHIVVHTYVKQHDTVVSLLDAGSNGFDRESNSKKRRAALADYVANGVFSSTGSSSQWGDPWSQCDSFVRWWDRETSTEFDTVL